MIIAPAASPIPVLGGLGERSFGAALLIQQTATEPGFVPIFRPDGAPGTPEISGPAPSGLPARGGLIDILV